MGDKWPLLLGAAIWATMLYSAFRGSAEEAGCPECGHPVGLDASGVECESVEDHSGWSSDLCRCQNDYHWNYESTVRRSGPAG